MVSASYFKPSVKYVEDIQMCGVNMTFIQLDEAKKTAYFLSG